MLRVVEVRGKWHLIESSMRYSVLVLVLCLSEIGTQQAGSRPSEMTAVLRY